MPDPQTFPNRPPAPKPTMRDVSRLAGVSTMTVSRVLADPSRVAAETRACVIAAVERLGHVPDLGAGALSSRRTNFIALILPTLTNSNFGDTAQGLAEALGEGYQLLIGYTLYRATEEERLVRSLLARRPRAVVVAGSVHTAATRRMLGQAGVPVVEIWDRPDAPLDRAVGFSNHEAGRVAARHLLSLGCRRPAAIGSQAGSEVQDHRGEARLQGFAAALREAGLRDAAILRLGAAPVSFDHGALMECRRRGIEVPGALSIVGFGDFEVGRQCEPAISTIRVDAKAIGTRTGRLLLHIIDGTSAPVAPEASDVDIELVVRGTSAARPGRATPS